MKKNVHYQSLLSKFINYNMIGHLICASVIRLCLVLYGIWHDQSSDVQYTDIDYKVFTDAARHVVESNSPYNRNTFRYSPLIAYLLIPNICLHPAFGKIFFCTIDLLVAYLIRKLVYHNVSEWNGYQSNNKSGQAKALFWAQRGMLLWLYNPMTLAISTRGNSDSLACFLVISTAYFLQTKCNAFVVGLLHGLSVHFRLYPIIYSLTYYMYLSRFSYYIKPGAGNMALSGKSLKNKQNKSLKKCSNQTEEKAKISMFRKENVWYIIPNMSQLMFVLGSTVAFTVLSALFYWLYGYTFLYESLIYHFVRVDFKHNFSLYFYLQYLAAWVKFDYWAITIWQPILMNLPPLILMLFFSIYFGLNRYCLNFAILSQTVVFVIYNKVITSQYFVWIMGVLPLCIWQIKFSSSTVVLYSLIWLIAQGAWLLPAYLLEFHGENTYLYIWIQGVSLFCAHIGILGRLVKNFITTMHETKRTD